MDGTAASLPLNEEAEDVMALDSTNKTTKSSDLSSSRGKLSGSKKHEKKSDQGSLSNSKKRHQEDSPKDSQEDLASSAKKSLNSSRKKSKITQKETEGEATLSDSKKPQKETSPKDTQEEQRDSNTESEEEPMSVESIFSGGSSKKSAALSSSDKKSQTLSGSSKKALSGSEKKAAAVPVGPKPTNVRPMFFNSKGRTNNPHRATVKRFKSAQQDQLETFKRHASRGKWSSVHHDHFDWYMFPIEDGSQSQYNVLSKDCLELTADAEWLAGYREGVKYVAKAWGWDVDLAEPIDPLEDGMGWTNWDVRLAKIIRSLWIFRQKDYMQSMQKFALMVAPRGGLSYGWICLDEVYFMTLP